MTRRELRRRQVGCPHGGPACDGACTSAGLPSAGHPSSRPRLTRAVGLLASIGAFVALTGCGSGDDGRAGASDIDDTVVALADLVVSDTTIVDDPMLVAPSTTSPPSSSAAPTTTVADTLAPTTVVTLPVPVAPPAPRADEPYVELGRIEIPRIGVDHVLLQGITLTTLDQGPGHWPGTALPGQLGNTVIAGHRTSHGKEFRDVDQLVPGDEVVFTTADGRFVYVVRETTIVKPDAMYIIDQTPEHTATLFACHPPGSVRERIVVHLDLATSDGSGSSGSSGSSDGGAEAAPAGA